LGTWADKYCSWAWEQGRHFYAAEGQVTSRVMFSGLGTWAVEGTSQATLGSSDQQKVPTTLSLFLNSEKSPAMLDI